MYSANVPIYSIAACDSGQSLAVAGNDGSLLLLQIDPNSSKMALQQARHLVQNAGGYNGYDDGPIVDMHPLDHDSQSVIIYATLYGAIICWDLRMPTNAWRLNSDLKQGVITTFCIDSNVSWLATGTSHGNHICWDLRFKLPIGECVSQFSFVIFRFVHKSLGNVFFFSRFCLLQPKFNIHQQLEYAKLYHIRLNHHG